MVRIKLVVYLRRTLRSTHVLGHFQSISVSFSDHNVLPCFLQSIVFDCIFSRFISFSCFPNLFSFGFLYRNYSHSLNVSNSSYYVHLDEVHSNVHSNRDRGCKSWTILKPTFQRLNVRSSSSVSQSRPRYRSCV